MKQPSRSFFGRSLTPTPQAAGTQLLSVALALSVLGATGCGSQQAAGPVQPASTSASSGMPAGIAATVNGEGISQGDLDSELNKLKGREVLQTLIDDRLIMQAAKKAQLTADPAEVKERTDELKKTPQYQMFAKANSLTDADLETKVRRSVLLQKLILQEVPESQKLQVYDQYKDSLEKIHIFHILVEADKRDLAKKIVADIKAGKDFEALAKEYSKDDISKAQGGDLGWMPKSAPLAPEFSKAAFALKVGELSAPVKTQFGWHIIKVTGHKRSFDELKRDIEDALTAQRQAQFVERLRLKAEIKSKYEPDKKAAPADASAAPGDASKASPGDAKPSQGSGH